MMKHRIGFSILAAVTVLALASCKDGEGISIESDVDAVADVDADGGGDVTADADADAVTDSDVVADIDADALPDADAITDADADALPDTDAIADADADALPDTDATADVDADAPDGGTPCTTIADCAAAEDGDACNGTLICQDGQCVLDAATVVTCDQTGLGACEVSTCSPTTGACATVSAADGVVCDDGDLCTSADVCGAGVCGGTAKDCDDSDYCTADACGVDGICTHTPIEGCTASCGDSVCNGTDNCLNCAADCGPCPATSCAGACGTNGETCSCDELCFGFGDCCEDICEFCGVEFPTAAPNGCGECTASCDGKSCGDDGCGGSCGDCGAGEICNDAFVCEACAVSCDGKTCGDDGCGGSCGACGAGELCDETGQCLGASCEGLCGTGAAAANGCFCDDGCFAFGDCCTDVCDFCEAELPEPAPNGCGACVPACTDKACGDDACGGSCGDCGVGETCNAGGTCDACVPSCGGKLCGDDGCGGSCGDCADGEACTSAGQCKVPSGASCADFCGVYVSGGACNCDSSCFAFGDCCDDICTECASTFPEPAPAGCGACVPDCTGKVCGDDGCGGECGACGDGETCTTAGDACTVATCDGHCGDESPSGCFCDDGCFGFGDCCDDICDFCEADFPDPTPGGCGECIPACDGKTCGPDGCGGECGACTGDDICTSAGTCQFIACCSGNDCCGETGTPGCGEPLVQACVCDQDAFCCATEWDANCAATAVNDCADACNCVADCTDKACGDDGCFGSCGECGEGQACLPGGTCVDDPAPTTCDEAHGFAGCCGLDGTVFYLEDGEILSLPCGFGNCGWDEEYGYYDCAETGEDPSGTFPAMCGAPNPDPSLCEPDCDGKDCGPDGQGGVCGECSADATCLAEGTCCVPLCDGKDCGDDGCGGDCGDCTAGNTCGVDGLCAPVACCVGNDCCGDTGGAGCSDPVMQSCVCSFDAFCCSTQWDSLCGGIATDECADACTCVPDCTGETPETPKVCGDDGCFGSCGTCGDGDTCVAEGTCCTPQCDGKVCGDDGCGGSCGDCDLGSTCDGAGACETAACCEGNDCCADNGTPGCSDPLIEACVCDVDAFCCDTSWDGFCAGIASDECVDSCNCTADCTDKQCGSDGCGGTCGACDEGLSCDANGACVGCVPDCGGKQCGDDGCGGTCGVCDAGDECNAFDLCVVIGTCEDACGGTSLAGCFCDDGCFAFGDCCTNICEFCPGEAPANECGVCVVDCAGKTCGDDGCGGSCGTCDAGDLCSDAQVCETPDSSCEGDCGALFGGGDCACDESCFAFGDCCDDICTFCAAEFPQSAPDGCGVCTPDCTGETPETPKVCGGDGCGGTCGECAGTDTCGLDGTCAACVPSCDGAACGADGCGGVCGTCDTDESCVSGVCESASCEGNCGLLAASGCGCDDFCFSIGDCCDDACTFCPAQAPGDECGACVPQCDGKTCGDDGCGSTCGDCSLTEACSMAGTCEVVACCQDNDCCSDTGTPGCTDAGLQVCVCALDDFCCTVNWDDLCASSAVNDCADQCSGPCVPACDGKSCGSDGCGGDCGTCADDQECVAGTCELAGCGNSTCDFGEDCSTCAADCGACSGECCSAHAEPGCDDAGVSACVCAIDTFCCAEAWDPTCVTVAENNCAIDCSTSKCGDGTCNPSEDCVTCPDDCGFCAPTAGDLVITEILQTPSLTSQVTEWFEVLNIATSPLNLAGMIVKDKGADSVTLSTASPVVISPDQYLVIGRTTNMGGGMTSDVGLGNKFYLAVSDAIILVMDGEIIDEVTYSTALGFPTPSGASMGLDPKSIFGNNNLGANWCISQKVYGSGPDSGTPRAGNEPCSQLATCTMDFEGANCPTSKLVCGASSTGGSCAVAVPPTCAPDGLGLSALKVVPGTPANLTFVDAVNSVKVAFASADAVAGTMVFRNFLGDPVATMTTSGSCALGLPTVQSMVFSEPVYGVTISAGAGSAGVWIDGLQINAP